VTAGRSYREAPDTDGEIQLVVAGTGGVAGAPAPLAVGRTVTARVVDAVGVDLVAEVAPPRAPVSAGGARG
jgi:ribosomal protein S12 methylthiotransferase